MGILFFGIDEEKVQLQKGNLNHDESYLPCCPFAICSW